MSDSPTDFTGFLDPAVNRFVARSRSFAKPGATPPSIRELRAAFDATCAHFHNGRPAGVMVTDGAIAGIATRTYTAGDTGPVVLYLHGGGFVLGGLDSHDDICADIAAATGLTVIAPDYALSPEVRHPVALDQCLAVFDALDTAIIPAGDSAGATLAAAITHRRRDRVLAQVLIYPWLGTPRDTRSYARNANAPILTAAAMHFFHDALVGDTGATYAPLDDPDFTGLPPTLLTAAEFDPLHDDATGYAARLTAAAIAHRLYRDTGLVHGHLRARHISSRAAASFERITAGITALAQGTLPE